MLPLVAMLTALKGGDSLDKTIDSIVRSETQRNPSVGLQVAVAKRGHVIFSRGYGWTDLQHSRACTADTSFHFDSISKHVTAALLLKLMERTKARPGDEVRKYLKTFKRTGVTLDQILSHTSGLGNYNDVLEGDKSGRHWSHRDVEGLINRSEPLYRPGTSWSYSNSGFYLAGSIVEELSRQPYERALQRYLAKPQGLQSLAVGEHPAPRHKIAEGFVMKGGRLQRERIDWSVPFSAGGVTGTASDLLRLEIGLESHKMLSNHSLRLMRSPHSAPDGAPIDYGLGTRLGSLDGHRAIGHTGSGGGFNTIFVDFPDDGVMVAVLSNVDSSTLTHSLCYRLSKTLLNLSRHQTTPVPLERETAQLRFGTYRTSNGPFEVYVDKGAIWHRPQGSREPGATDPYIGQLTSLLGGSGVGKMWAKKGTVDWLFFYDCGLLDEACPRVGP
ncbi:MAG TPA: serine hydrolase domain-containing protein [Fimbriimonas sp.]|nr:serine hydrolase domain-containing protein [Fimbriimonas sp.]